MKVCERITCEQEYDDFYVREKGDFLVRAIFDKDSLCFDEPFHDNSDVSFVIDFGSGGGLRMYNFDIDSLFGELEKFSGKKLSTDIEDAKENPCLLANVAREAGLPFAMVNFIKHGGVAYSLSSFRHLDPGGYDSGVNGMAFLTPGQIERFSYAGDNIQEEFERIAQMILNDATAIANGEVYRLVAAPASRNEDGSYELLGEWKEIEDSSIILGMEGIEDAMSDVLEDHLRDQFGINQAVKP